MIDFGSTSVPAWARNPGADAPPTGPAASYAVVGVGSGQAVAQRWAQHLPGVTLMIADDADTAADQLTDALRCARVGVRVAIAGPVGACLRLRAATLDAGAEDDEIHIQATEPGEIEVFCAHCTAGTPTTTGVDGQLPCSGCGRTLVVYYHVSRRLGKYLGFQVDAETLPVNEATS